MREVGWGGLDVAVVYAGTFFLSSALAGVVYFWMQPIVEVIPNVDHQLLFFMTAMMVQVLVNICLVWLMVVSPGKGSWCELGLNKPNPAQLFVNGIGGGILLCIGIMLSSIPINILQPQLEPQYFETILQRGQHWWEIGLLFLAGSVMAPFCEEVLFRGMLYGFLRSKLNIIPAIVIAGSLFALAHYDMWRTIPLALGGMVLCYFYEKTKSIWVTIMAHGIWNGIMTGLVLWSTN